MLFFHNYIRLYFNRLNGSIVILSPVVSAIIWTLLTWYFGIPSSSSHALAGSVSGAAIVAGGFHRLNYKGFLKIIEGLIISPIILLL